jgi:hypothetical protein
MPSVCTRIYDQLPERRFEFISFWGFLVFLLYSIRRVACRRCQAVVVEEVPWGDGKRGFVDHPLSNRDNEARFFGNPNELSRIKKPAVVMLPSQPALPSR